MNPNTEITLEESVEEVLAILTGLDLYYEPNQDRFRAVTRAINRAVRANATENEWSHYTSTEQVGYAYAGERVVPIRAELRPRIIGDDAVRLVNRKGRVVTWAYFLPRDSIHKYDRADGELRVAITKQMLEFSRPFYRVEHGLMIEVPVMREPELFKLPELPSDPNTPIPDVPEEILKQKLDFDYPDVIIARAAFMYAQTDPLMQPRAQILEQQYKDLMYNLIERDTRNTDAPYLNDFILPISNSIDGRDGVRHRHPHADEGWHF